MESWFHCILESRFCYVYENKKKILQQCECKDSREGKRKEGEEKEWTKEENEGEEMKMWVGKDGLVIALD